MGRKVGIDRAPSLRLGPLLALLAVAGCAELAPLRNPPRLLGDDPAQGITTREEAIQRLGPPGEVRASDTGEVLVYRRPAVVEINPSRYYGEDGGDRWIRYERLLLFLDESGKVARWSIEPE